MEQEDTKTRRFFDRSDEVIGACIEVHRHLGPGLLESAYEASLCQELSLRGMRFERQRRVPLIYKGVALDCGFVLDVLVEGRILVEVKAVERLLGVHQAQVITYLKLAGIDTGLLVNFNVPVLTQGLRRLLRGKDFPVESTP
jgi:GxxExxY protein